MTTTDTLRARLATLLDHDSIAPDADLPGYAIDGVVPGAVVSPQTEEQVGELLKLASTDGWGVIPRGNGSLMALGGVPERADLVLALNGLPHSIDHVPGDLTVTVSAATTFDELRAVLAGAGQWLPLDPPLASRRTVGGVLASNLAGPLSLSYGTARDVVIGMRVVGADGVSTKSGGKVVKNVTGFDLAKVHLGALGTLGVIVGASLKVAPLPRRDATLSATFADLTAAMNAAQKMLKGSTAPQALEVAMPPAESEAGDPCTLHARLMGGSSGVTRRIDDHTLGLRQAGATRVELLEGDDATSVWTTLADFGWTLDDGLNADGDSLLLRLGCLPSRTGELASAVVDAARRHTYPVRILAGPGRGVLRFFSPGPDRGASNIGALVDDLRGIAASLDGYAVVERCPAQAKAGLDVWGDPGQGIALMRRLKEQMDPRHTLNPGRYVGGI